MQRNVTVPQNELIVGLCLLPSLSVICWLGGMHFGGPNAAFLAVGVLTIGLLLLVMLRYD